MHANVFFVIVFLLTLSGSARADDKKRANEPCTQDSECKGHCYQTKSQGKKCVDCDPNTIRDTRSEIDIWCHNTKKSCSKCQQEVWEDDYTIGIDAFRKCIDARKKEMSQCWNNGADDSMDHSGEITRAEVGKRNCEDLLSSCRSDGLTYTCSPNTFSSKNSDTDNYCSRDQDNLCSRWSKDSTKVDCRAIEDAMGQASKCVSAQDSLKSSCLGKFSRSREGYRDRANKGYSLCKDILDYKRSNSFCN